MQIIRQASGELLGRRAEFALRGDDEPDPQRVDAGRVQRPPGQIALFDFMQEAEPREE